MNGVRIGILIGALAGAVVVAVSGVGSFWIVVVLAAIGGGFGSVIEKQRSTEK